MPDPIPQQSTASSNPPPKESTWQTIKRNLKPEIDLSRSALGPGHQFDFGPSPQQDGEDLYNGTFGSTHQRAIKELRKILDDHGEHIPERHRTNFESFISRVSDDLLAAADKGRTKDGGPMTMPSRALTGAVGGALQVFPIAGRLGDATNFYAERVLDFSKLKGHVKISDARQNRTLLYPEEALTRATQGWHDRPHLSARRLVDKHVQ
jgi:hypothetical protein